MVKKKLSSDTGWVGITSCQQEPIIQHKNLQGVIKNLTCEQDRQTDRQTNRKGANTNHETDRIIDHFTCTNQQLDTCFSEISQWESKEYFQCITSYLCVAVAMLFVKVETGQHKCVRKIVNDDNVEQYIYEIYNFAFDYKEICVAKGGSRWSSVFRNWLFFRQPKKARFQIHSKQRFGSISRFLLHTGEIIAVGWNIKIIKQENVWCVLNGGVQSKCCM